MADTRFNINSNEYLPLRDVVFNTLRDAILTGKLVPGERLMENQLAEKLGVSRTPVREALRMLELGNLVELADSDEIYAHTLHPYSQALLASVPIPDPDKEAQKEAKVLSGDVPSPINPKPGCPFANRCVHATEKCRTETPKLREARPGHFVSCHLDF